VTEIPKPPLRPVWPQLRALYAASREDWIASDAESGLCRPEAEASPTAEAAVIAAEQAGVPYPEALAEAVRVMRDAGGKAGDLLGLARARSRSAAFPGTPLTREERDELRAQALASCAAATERHKRPTGPMPALRLTGPQPALTPEAERDLFREPDP
jgi:hypothetical protein